MYKKKSKQNIYKRKLTVQGVLLNVFLSNGYLQILSHFYFVFKQTLKVSNVFTFKLYAFLNNIDTCFKHTVEKMHKHKYYL